MSRAFFIGNGPSLDPEDLTRLSAMGEVTIACNHIDLIYPRTQWRPDHYIFVDRHGNPDWRVGLMEHVVRDQYDCWLSEEIYGMQAPHPRKKTVPERWTRHPGPAYVATWLAKSLGHSCLYLLGCDMDFRGTDPAGVGDYSYGDMDPNHFDRTYATRDAYAHRVTVRRAEGLIMAAHWQSWVEEVVSVVNCSRVGNNRLPWDRAKLEDVLDATE